MIEFTIKSVKQGFFDSPKVLKAISAAKRKVFSKFGAFVRRRAKSSIKDAPKSGAGRRGRKSRRPRVSRPGSPPYSRTGLLRKFIFFAYDTKRQSVVIGPARINRPTGAPKALEYGGRVETPKFFTQRKRGITSMRIRARPFMRPAFKAEKPKLRELWRGSVK